MADLRLMQELQRPRATKIVLLILDGLGGLPSDTTGLTELETARTPNLDRLASEGALGQIIPISRGITPGSGPAHLALFGYDPLRFNVGRGVLEATGIGMRVKEGDVAARGNLCTVDAEGRITDRRAGRISTDDSTPLVEKLAEIQIPEVRIEARPVREYRFAVLMQGERLHPALEDTDPQQTGVPPLPVVAHNPEAQRTADLFNAWVQQARRILSDQPRANAFTLRGFSTNPSFPQFPEVYGLRSACVAVYPMYRGVSSLVGMQALEFEGEKPSDEFEVLARYKDNFDFFFVHIKKPDSKGEDGDFEGKVSVIEALDEDLPLLLDTDPDVLAVTGDHSTPTQLRSHSWHPVPFLLWAPSSVRRDQAKAFGETTCSQGGLGTFRSVDIMPLLMAHAGRLEKFGA